MTKKQFEKKLKDLESKGWQFVTIQPFVKYARYHKNGQFIEIGTKMEM